MISSFNKSIISFEESLKCPEGDKNAETYNELALCLLQEKDFEGAEKNMMKSFELDPENTKVISNLGYLALARGDKEMAQKYFTTVLEYAPNDAIAASELAKLEASE